MGSVKERYLQYEKAGDQYLGRVVSGLDVNGVSFGVSPTYFKNDGNNNDVPTVEGLYGRGAQYKR